MEVSRDVLMSKATSVFLDVLRIIAAYGVFLGHCSFPWFAPQVPALAEFGRLGHEFVIIFFVLSGYVIGYSTLSGARNSEHYALARLSRLYSVVLPGVFLTEVLRFIGSKFNPVFYASFDRGNGCLRPITALFFLQECWFVSSSPPTNAPLWSLGYEFWYYVLFGVVVFAPSMRTKIGLAFLVALIAGPKILLLLPIWLLGVGTYLVQRRVQTNRPFSIAAFVAATIITVRVVLTDWECPWRVYSGIFFGQKLWYSSAFISDFILGVTICVTIFFFENSFRQINVPQFVAKPTRYVADTTFSLYVFHYPFLVFLAAVADVKKMNLWAALAMILFVILIVGLASTVTEARKRNLRGLMASISQRWRWVKARETELHQVT